MTTIPTPQATQVRTAGDFRIVLPGTWLRVPLDEDDRVRVFARAAVIDAVGRSDRLASLRRDAVTRVVDLARQTRESGAHTLLMATQMLPGVPFSASVVGRDVPWPTPVAPSTPAVASAVADSGDPAPAGAASGQDAMRDRLEAAYPGREIRDLRSGPAVRELSHGVLRGKEEEIPSLQLAYWIPRPDSDELLHIRFTTPTAGVDAPVAAFLDAVADSISWLEQPGSQLEAEAESL